MKLQFEYDETKDVLTIEGIQYSGELFRDWSANGMPVGQVFSIEKRSEEWFAIRRHDGITVTEVEALQASKRG